MDITVGKADHWRRGVLPKVHVIVQVAQRHVVACSGRAAKETMVEPFADVHENLTCTACRRFWKHASGVAETV